MIDRPYRGAAYSSLAPPRWRPCSKASDEPVSRQTKKPDHPRFYSPEGGHDTFSLPLRLALAGLLFVTLLPRANADADTGSLSYEESPSNDFLVDTEMLQLARRCRMAARARLS